MEPKKDIRSFDLIDKRIKKHRQYLEFKYFDKHFDIPIYSNTLTIELGRKRKPFSFFEENSLIMRIDYNINQLLPFFYNWFENGDKINLNIKSIDDNNIVTLGYHFINCYLISVDFTDNTINLVTKFEHYTKKINL